MCTTVMTGATLHMSLEAIGWVLRDAPDVPSQCVSVLIGLADHADKRGRGAYPSAGTLATYARKSERQVRYDLSLLAEAKLIRPGDQSEVAKYPVNRRPVVYDLAMELTKASAGVQSVAPQAGVQLTSGVQSASPLQPTAPQSAPDLQEQAGVQSASPQVTEVLGCNTAQLGVQPTAYKPSLNLNLSEVQVGEGGSGGETTDPATASLGDEAADPAAKPKKPRKVAHRIPEDFRVTPEMVAWARREVPQVDGRRATEAFIDHWTSASGANARKHDWVAAWRNWMRKADDDLGSGRKHTGSPNGSRPVADSPGAQKARRAMDAGAQVQAMIDEGRYQS